MRAVGGYVFIRYWWPLFSDRWAFSSYWRRVSRRWCQPDVFSLPTDGYSCSVFWHSMTVRAGRDYRYIRYDYRPPFTFHYSGIPMVFEAIRRQSYIDWWVEVVFLTDSSLEGDFIDTDCLFFHFDDCLIRYSVFVTVRWWYWPFTWFDDAWSLPITYCCCCSYGVVPGDYSRCPTFYKAEYLLENDCCVPNTHIPCVFDMTIFGTLLIVFWPVTDEGWRRCFGCSGRKPYDHHNPLHSRPHYHTCSVTEGKFHSYSARYPLQYRLTDSLTIVSDGRVVDDGGNLLYSHLIHWRCSESYCITGAGLEGTAGIDHWRDWRSVLDSWYLSTYHCWWKNFGDTFIRPFIYSDLPSLMRWPDLLIDHSRYSSCCGDEEADDLRILRYRHSIPHCSRKAGRRQCWRIIPDPLFIVDIRYWPVSWRRVSKAVKKGVDLVTDRYIPRWPGSRTVCCVTDTLTDCDAFWSDLIYDLQLFILTPFPVDRGKWRKPMTVLLLLTFLPDHSRLTWRLPDGRPWPYRLLTRG